MSEQMLDLKKELLILEALKVANVNEARAITWNSLFFDLDAFHLQVELKIHVRYFQRWGDDIEVVQAEGTEGCYTIEIGDDARKATRLAITEAAAAVGRSKP